MTANKLRKKYPEFVYKSFDYEYKKSNLNIWFNFVILPKFEFTTKLIIKNVLEAKIKKTNNLNLENLIFSLGLIEMLNYWKLTCSPKILIEAGNLNKNKYFF